MSFKNFLSAGKAEFTDHINRYSMAFKNPKYESEFALYKFEKKNFLIIIGISIFFTMILYGLFVLLISVKNIDDLGFKLPNYIYVTAAVLWNAALIIEAIIFTIPKISILRGFFFNSFPMIALNCISFYQSEVLVKNPTPLYVPAVLLYILMALIISFIYVPNWICGGLQILCIIGLFLYQLLSSDCWGWFPNKGIYLCLSISTAVSVILSIYYFEYFQRKAIFMRLQAEEQIQNIKQIIDNLPEPLIISIKGKINYKNKALGNLEATNRNLLELGRNPIIEEIKQVNINSENEGYRTDRNLNLLRNETSVIEKIINIENVSLKEIASAMKDLNGEHFEYKNQTEIVKLFEVNSISLKHEEQKMNLYLLKDLTPYMQIKDLENREEFQRIYFASMTHDFRTPLGIIKGHAEILLSMNLDSEIQKNVRIIYNSATILTLLVQDVLDYSQIKSGNLRVVPFEFNIREEFELIIELFEGKFKDKGLSLILMISESVPEIVFNDSNRIKQILLNLVSNAFKFTMNGSVTLSVYSAKEDEEIIVIVKDTGVGIREEDQAKLFSEFGKLEDHKELNPTGVGLGLHICKKMVEHLGGKISVHSRINEGTSFTFSFSNLRKNNYPINSNLENISSIRMDISTKFLNKVQPVQSELSLDKSSSLISPQAINLIMEEEHKQKECSCSEILIVDDDYGIRNITINYCQRKLVKYDEAENGQRAVEKVMSKLNSECCKFYKLIFIDYYMPIMDGVKASVIIKNKLQNYPDNNTKIILVSGLANDDYSLINNLEENPFYKIDPKPLPFSRFNDLISGLKL